MAHFLNDSQSRMRPATLLPQGLITRMTHAIDRFKSARATRKALGQLSQHTDAQLADIGLSRSDLATRRFDKAADDRARAITRLYR